MHFVGSVIYTVVVVHEVNINN